MWGRGSTESTNSVTSFANNSYSKLYYYGCNRRLCTRMRFGLRNIYNWCKFRVLLVSSLPNNSGKKFLLLAPCLFIKGVSVCRSSTVFALDTVTRTSCGSFAYTMSKSGHRRVSTLHVRSNLYVSISRYPGTLSVKGNDFELNEDILSPSPRLEFPTNVLYLC